MNLSPPASRFLCCNIKVESFLSRSSSLAVLSTISLALWVPGPVSLIVQLESLVTVRDESLWLIRTITVSRYELSPPVSPSVGIIARPVVTRERNMLEMLSKCTRVCITQFFQVWDKRLIQQFQISILNDLISHHFDPPLLRRSTSCLHTVVLIT